MTTPRCPRLRLLPLAGLALAAACAAGPAWTDDERVQLAALQQAVLAALAEPPAARATDATVPMPDGCDLGDADFQLHFLPPHERTGDYEESWSIGPQRPATARLYRGSAGGMLAVAGHTLPGFDAVHAFTLDPTRGAVVVGTRRGEQTVVTAQSTWSGSLWHRSFRPEVSTDGSCFVYVQAGGTTVLAPTDAPERGVPMPLPSAVMWPVWPGRDGKRLRSIVRHQGIVEVRDGDRVVATADDYTHASYDEGLDRLRVHLTTAGKTRLLFGDRLTPPLDSYRWIEETRDGAHWLAAGRDGDDDCLVFDDQVVLRCRTLTWMDLADDGSTWACAVQEGEQSFVVRPDGRSGPFAGVTRVQLAPDGSSLAVATRVARQRSWTLDGQPLGADHASVGDLLLLPARGGAVFTARDGSHHWVVTPAGRDGPWDDVAGLHLLADGRGIAFLAQRGRELHRRVLRLP